ncbi:hypothetical protein AEAC466_14405 [Asticcacaulis sp. AC466]|uniref:DMT family transporter n=1 Tax=Asticcacaulis sp. AC466 TaxID=1282362 RepID=UPI0003C3B65C|nr:DMT family transporter [Asticcacaulis sp. AC466]ESQ83051.1 hypothetical protein AEAC466_14405 [Asticcacaulis sp. AC466]
MTEFKLGDVKRGGLFALLSALLFGASTPAAKAIIGGVHPLMLAGLLYLGSGCGVAIIRLTILKQAGAKLKLADLPWLAATVLFGGALGPALLMYGLGSTSGSAASLLLTLEGVFTAVIAWVAFKEPFNRRIGWGMLAIFVGAVILAMRGPGGHAAFTGALAVAGACLCWAIDNNCTSKISHVDAPTLTSIKGLVAGVANLALAFLVGAHMPSVATAGLGMIIGLLGYGASLVLFVFALREIGAARTGAYYSTAPFIGALIGLLLLHEPWSIALILAGALMAVGVWLHLTEPGAEA